jgi:peptide/nickel transport system substrate-binding protein
VKEMKKRKVVIGAFSLCVLLIVSSSTPALGQGKGIIPSGKAVYVSNQNSFEFRKAFDPHTAMGGSTCRTLTSMVFDSLVTKDSKGDFQPALAESWDIAKDWSSISFKLREGVKFHNGDPFTAKDVKFSLERLMRDDLRFVYLAEIKKSLTKIEILDDYNIRIHVNNPYPGFLDRCGGGSIAILSKSYLEKVGDDGFAARPIGAGPFKVVKFERDISVDLEAVENHYRKTPYVKNLRLLVVPEHSTRLAMLKTGEVDFILAAPSQIPFLDKDPNIRIMWGKHTFVITLMFADLSYPEDSPFKNPLVRRATSLAIDRKAIAEAFNGYLEPWGSYLAPYHPGFDPKRNQTDPYNPAEAKKLLAQAGFPKGIDTVLVYTTTQKEIFEAIHSQLQEVGIRCKLNMLEYGTWIKSYVAATQRGLCYGSGPWWSGFKSPFAGLHSHIVGSWSHKLATPEIIKAMEKLERAISNKEIAETARKLDDTILESTIRIPLWSVHYPYGMRKRVEEYPGVPGVAHPLGFEYLKLSAQ